MSQQALISSGLAQMGLDHSASLVARLDTFVYELIKWNKTYNLTSIREPEQIVSHHLLDSLVIQQYVTGNNIIDVGSGGGFPGIPLALYFPEKQFTLLDSNGKKTRFLQQMKISLGLPNCEIVQSRSEDFVAEFDQITCRAFASLADITKKTAHLTHSTGEILALKARLDADEMGLPLHSFEVAAIHELSVPRLNAERHLVVLRKIV